MQTRKNWCNQAKLTNAHYFGSSSEPLRKSSPFQSEILQKLKHNAISRDFVLYCGSGVSFMKQIRPTTPKKITRLLGRARKSVLLQWCVIYEADQTHHSQKNHTTPRPRQKITRLTTPRPRQQITRLFGRAKKINDPQSRKNGAIKQNSIFRCPQGFSEVVTEVVLAILRGSVKVPPGLCMHTVISNVDHVRACPIRITIVLAIGLPVAIISCRLCLPKVFSCPCPVVISGTK